MTGNAFLAGTPETFTHDADGNLTQDGRWTYTWDAENRLTQVESRSDAPSLSRRKVVWEFDGKGRRTASPRRRGPLQQLAAHLAELIPVDLLSRADEGPNSRARLFTLRLTGECFLWPMLKPRTAGREVVRQVQALACRQGKGAVDESASAYLQARRRLPPERLERILAATAQAAERRARARISLQGRPVKAGDGRSGQAPDPAANQKEDPQPSGQKPGCGFPVLKLVGLFSLASGALLEVGLGNLPQHDLRLFRRLWECLKAGDLLLGDRAYGDY